jgi:hypothetical protein
LLGELDLPRGLKHFELHGYSSTCFPASWFMSISHHLPNLVTITLFDMPTCSSLPPLGQLPNLFLFDLPCITKIDKDLCGDKGAFPRLSYFRLNTMDRLEEWNTTYSCEDGVEVFMFPVLDYLDISHRERLKLKSCPPTFRQCDISYSSQAISSLGELDSISHLSSCSRSTKLMVMLTNYQNMRMLRHYTLLSKSWTSACHFRKAYGIFHPSNCWIVGAYRHCQIG